MLQQLHLSCRRIERVNNMQAKCVAMKGAVARDKLMPNTFCSLKQYAFLTKNMAVTKHCNLTAVRRRTSQFRDM